MADAPLKTVIVVTQQQRTTTPEGRVVYRTRTGAQGGHLYEHTHVGPPSDAPLVDQVVKELAAKMADHDEKMNDYANMEGLTGKVGAISVIIEGLHVRIFGPAVWRAHLSWLETGPNGPQERFFQETESDHPGTLPHASELYAQLQAEVRGRAEQLAAAEHAAAFGAEVGAAPPAALPETWDPL